MSAVKLAHPILHLEVIGPDGARQDRQHVFCRYQKKSVPLDVCCGCVHCDAITTGGSPLVMCTVPGDDCPPPDDPRGERTEVGTLLHDGAVAIEPGASLRDALAFLGGGGHRSIPVVDDKRRLVGIVHEMALRRPRALGTDPTACAVSVAMTTAVAIHEAVPVRRALHVLASAHAREAVVVNDAGAPVGVFHDVDGLRFVANERKRSRAMGCADDDGIHIALLGDAP